MSFNQVVISSGHSVNCQGMSDVINEVNEAIRVTNRVYEIVKASGRSCYRYHDTARSSSQNLANIVNFHNQYKDGIDISVHFNANKHTDSAMGVEVCHYNQPTLASNLSAAISKASGLKNRGAKQRKELYFLRRTNKTALLIEVCFGDSTKDCQLYKANFEAICQAIASALTGVNAPANIPVNNHTPQSTTSNGSYKVKIKADVLNVRKGPGANYPVATTVKQNEVYTIVGEQNGFLKLKSGAGWISKNYTVRV